MFNNNKYLKNFRDHRLFIFLSNKVFENNVKAKGNGLNNKEFLEILELNKQFYRTKKKNFSNMLFKNTDDLSKENLFNNKFFDFLNILQMTNKVNHIFLFNFLLNLYRYSYLFKFFFEFFIIFSILIYSFKNGTFY